MSNSNTINSNLPNKLISRIAPTPSGLLHVGNAYNFLLTWLHVRKSGGSLRLRIDDMDAERVTHEYLNDIFLTLDWLGLDWDEGPSNVADHQQNFSQTLRIEEYRKVINQLWENGNSFACECSRKDIRATSPDGEYVGTCRNRALNWEPGRNSLRINTDSSEVHFKEWEKGPVHHSAQKLLPDFVICRKDGLPAYQVASLLDDVRDGINFVVRGQDLMPSTVAQLFLAELAGKADFQQVTFRHHPLLLGKDGQKISKSSGGTKGISVRQQFRDPVDFYAQVSQRWGLPENATSAKQLLALLSPDLRETCQF